jgi:parvulin-like peptidyl-prolyl isomerase
MQQITSVRVLAVLAAVGLASACQAAGSATPSPDVWAVVDTREIRREEVEKAYRGAVQPTATPASDAERLTVQLSVLDELITQEILRARATALGIAAPDSEVEDAFAERRRSVPDEAFQQQLAERGLTADDIKQGLRRELSVRKVLDQEVTSKIVVTDEDISAFYEQNRTQFNLPETQFRLAQIVVTPTRNPQVQNRANSDAATAAEAREKANMLMERLRGGADFAEVALDYSEDPQSIAQSGDLGFVPLSALEQASPQLRGAVEGMQPGTVSLVTIGTNYTILMLLSREEAGQRELSTPDVRDGIRDMLRARQQELLQTAYITAARQDADIVNYLAQQVVAAQGRLQTLTPAPQP